MARIFTDQARGSRIRVFQSTGVFLVIAILFFGLTSPKMAAAEDPSDPLSHTVTLPLKDGKLSLGRLADVLLKKMGVEVDGLAGPDKPSMRVNDSAGRFKLASISLATRRVVTFEANDQELVITFDEARLRREEKRLRSTMRLLVQGWFPDATIQAQQDFGMFVHGRDGATVRPKPEILTPEVVVLVHGLDDPGKAWNVLAPVLLGKGFTVCELVYPNDQPILASADLLSRNLEQLKVLGVERVSMVGHSMGGLVSREVLTNPNYYAGRGSGHTTRPDVTRLIMVATPNHGTKMARLRLAAEIREQVERMFEGNGGFLNGIFDGAGEAKIDLLPNSEFLTTLNARKLPPDVNCTIIAGRSSPITKGRVERLQSVLNKTSPKALQDSLDRAFADLLRYTDGGSDGLITVESTRLADVEDHLIVAGNHLTVIRNYAQSSKRIPPAVPVILKRLALADE